MLAPGQCSWHMKSDLVPLGMLFYISKIIFPFLRKKSRLGQKNGCLNINFVFQLDNDQNHADLHN